MTEDYKNACRIYDALRGKHVTVLCDNLWEARRKLYDLVRMCDAIERPYRLCKAVGHGAIIFYETIEDGGISIETWATRPMV